MSIQNKVTLFSNGIADFVRSYSVSGEKTEISIPVKKQHVGDVLASLNLYGNVSLLAPPSFSNFATNTFVLNSNHTFEDLIVKLSGAKVIVNEIEGTLMGLHSEQVSTGGSAFVEKYIVVFAAGIHKVPIKNIIKFEFVDSAIQDEINKALQINYQKIKPNSVSVNVAVKSIDGKNTDAIVQYNVPAAAWKICYRISESKVSESKEKIEFFGMAVVDNNTDEDWKDVIVSVVTGEPITFSTDLAEAKIPNRSHVNIVKDQALESIEVPSFGPIAFGNVSLPPSIGTTACDATSDNIVKAMSASRSRNSSACSSKASGKSNELDEAIGGSSVIQSDNSSKEVGGSSVIQSDNSSKEVGDFSVFTSKNPLTVVANTSAVIPIFQATLNDTKVVLHYDAKNNPQRPYRSLQFKNETEHSLGRGVCTFYQENLYSGTCVLPATKQGEEQLLPVSLETGVKVTHSSLPTTHKKVSILNGLMTTVTSQLHVLNYVIHNSKDEEFEIYLDVPVIYPNKNSKFVATISFERYGDGVLDEEVRNIDAVNMQDLRRYKFSLPAKGVATLSATETLVASSKTELTAGNYIWLNKNFIQSNNDFSKTKEVKELVALQSKLEEFKNEINTLIEKQDKLEAKQDRLRQNLASSGNDEQSAKWRVALAKAEDEITKIEETMLPNIRVEQKDLQNKIDEIMKKISFDFQ